MRLSFFLISFDFFIEVHYIVYNVMSHVGFGFVPFEDDAAPPLLDGFTWLNTNYNRDNHNVTHFYCTPFL